MSENNSSPRSIELGFTTFTDTTGNTYTVDSLLGKGGQGAVYKLQGNLTLVLKCATNAEGKIITDEYKYASYSRSVNAVMAMGDLYHVAKPLVMLKKPFNGYIMRFVTGMKSIKSLINYKGHESISSFIGQTGGFLRRYKLLLETAKVLKKLYDKGIVYGDISPDNVYISEGFEDNQVWLIDGDNIHFSENSFISIGTPYYRAPEIFNNECNTVFSDLYSFALLCYQVLTFSKAFVGKNMEEDSWESDDWNDESIDKSDAGLLDWCGKHDGNNPQCFGLPITRVTTPGLLNLFSKTFEEGKENKYARPSYDQWIAELEYIIRNYPLLPIYDEIEPKMMKPLTISIKGYRFTPFYQEDDDGNEEYLGSSRIKDTSLNYTIQLDLKQAELYFEKIKLPLAKKDDELDISITKKRISFSANQKDGIKVTNIDDTIVEPKSVFQGYSFDYDGNSKFKIYVYQNNRLPIFEYDVEIEKEEE